jgi:hypothetical protein
VQPWRHVVLPAPCAKRETGPASSARVPTASDANLRKTCWLDRAELGDTIKHISAWARVKIVQSSQHPGIFAQTPCDTWAVIVGFFYTYVPNRYR